MRKLIGHERLLYVGACVFVHKEGKLLLQKRTDNGFWCSAGGGTELGETVEDTAKRELLEETGLTANSLELLGVFSGKELFYTYPNGDMVSNVSVAYLCEDFSGILVRETNETSDLQWFEIDDLPESISPPDKPAFLRCVEVLKTRNNQAKRVDFSIEPVGAYREFVNKQIADSWSGPNIVSRGILHDTRTHEGFVAVSDGEAIGYILYNIIGAECEITVLESLREKQGVGGALIKAVTNVAKKANCNRLWLITTNDNTQAIRFYQRYGFLLKAVHIDAIEEARNLKPQIPPIGDDGIPIAHEFEFEIQLV
jgi:8-oxo-dGTP pyrophosphatase MutT (NUDIX family)/RimJ/RimL family protein N-acetyltransferase